MTNMLPADWTIGADNEIDLQSARIDAVARHLVTRGARRVVDLGCGNGDLLMRLREESSIQTIVGLDLSMDVLLQARERLGLRDFDSGTHRHPRVALMHGSFTSKAAALKNFDAATLVETIEHVNPNELPALEETVFHFFRPRHVIVTTPNKDFNVIYGLRDREFRHPDHRFEWTRRQFTSWVDSVAEANGYAVIVLDIGQPDAELGAPTQMAIFSLLVTDSHSSDIRR